ASTHDVLLIFSSFGKVYWKKVYEIPVATRTARGKAVVNLVPLEPGESIRAYLPVSSYDPERFVVMVTEKGILKKTELQAYSNPRKAGVKAINIDEDDRLITVALATEDQDVFLATSKGLSLRFPVKTVRAIGRVGRGVIGIRLNKGDVLVGMEILNDASAILTVTENGYGKKTNVSDYRVASRGNKGIFTIKTSKRNGLVVGIQQVDKDQEVMLITQKGKLIRMNLKSLRNIGRLTQGVRMIHMAPDEKVVSIAKIMENEGDLEEGNAENAPSGGGNGSGNGKRGGNGSGNGEKPLN
ncbi:MAG: DNA gyrase C-terminal beta-propeller domain-containing protein, partial [bacterium]